MNHVLARLGTLCTLVVFVGLTCGCDGELPATKRADLDRQISSFEAKPDCVAALDISRAHEDEREFGRALGFFQKMGRMVGGRRAALRRMARDGQEALSRQPLSKSLRSQRRMLAGATIP